jgi:hypothetical protein
MTGWRNRITGQGEEAPDQLLANPLNWRLHPAAQQEALVAALDEVGWIQQVVVNRVTGHLVDGHLRVILALRRDESTVPVLYVELDPTEEALVLATLDPIAALAGADKEQLEALLGMIQTEEPALHALLADLADTHRVFASQVGASPSVQRALDTANEWEDEPAGSDRASGDGYIHFAFGSHRGRVARAVYDSFVAAYQAYQRDHPGEALLDDVLRGWLDV